MTMVTENPWEGLQLPADVALVTAKRVDPSLRWNFFWGRSLDGKYLLVLRHAQESLDRHMPLLRGVQVTRSVSSDGAGPFILWSLQDAAHRDIFYRLCCDIVEGTSGASTESEAIALAIARTWRWHHLLRGGGDERLGPEEQKGLIGELLCLEERLIPVIGAHDAVTSWMGPLGAPKDFEVALVCVEAKARRAGGTPYVAISSEAQLDLAGLDALFLHVTDLDAAPATSEGAFMVTTAAQRVRELIQKLDPGVIELYESRLQAVGFRWADDYTDSWWVMGNVRLYRVTEDFPRIAASALMPGVSRVQYAVALVDCEPFRTDDATLLGALKGSTSYGD
jgi:hypothetical protein